MLTSFRARARDRGFSFIELLAYMAIAALLILAAVPQFNQYRHKALVSNMQNDVRNASLKAEAAMIDAVSAKKGHGSIQLASRVIRLAASSTSFDAIQAAVAETKTSDANTTLAVSDEGSGDYLITGTNTKAPKTEVVYASKIVTNPDTGVTVQPGLSTIDDGKVIGGGTGGSAEEPTGPAVDLTSKCEPVGQPSSSSNTDQAAAGWKGGSVSSSGATVTVSFTGTAQAFCDWASSTKLPIIASSGTLDMSTAYLADSDYVRLSVTDGTWALTTSDSGTKISDVFTMTTTFTASSEAAATSFSAKINDGSVANIQFADSVKNADAYGRYGMGVYAQPIDITPAGKPATKNTVPAKGAYLPNGNVGSGIAGFQFDTPSGGVPYSAANFPFLDALKTTGRWVDVTITDGHVYDQKGNEATLGSSTTWTGRVFISKDRSMVQVSLGFSISDKSQYLSDAQKSTQGYFYNMASVTINGYSGNNIAGSWGDLR